MLQLLNAPMSIIFSRKIMADQTAEIKCNKCPNKIDSAQTYVLTLFAISYTISDLIGTLKCGLVLAILFGEAASKKETFEEIQ